MWFVTTLYVLVVTSNTTGLRKVHQRMNEMNDVLVVKALFVVSYDCRMDVLDVLVVNEVLHKENKVGCGVSWWW